METEELNDISLEFSMKMSLDKTKVIYSLCFPVPVNAFESFVDGPISGLKCVVTEEYCAKKIITVFL